MNTIIEKIRAEVNKLPEEYKGLYKQFGNSLGFIDGLDMVKKILSDLEKEEKPIEELEEEIERYLSTEWELDEDLNKDEPIYIYDCTWEDLKIFARHFAKWGAEHAKECEEKPNKVKADFGIYRFQQKFCIHCEIPHCTGTIDYLKSCPYLNK